MMSRDCYPRRGTGPVRQAVRPRRRRSRAAAGRHDRGGPRRGHQQAAVQGRTGHLRSGLRQHRVVHVGDHLHRRRRRHPALPRATRSTSWPTNSTFLEVSYLLIYGELPNCRPARRVRRTRSAGTPCCTRNSSGSSRASRATRTRCRCSPRRSRRCRPSTRTPWTRSIPTMSSCRPCGCSPSCRPSPPTPTRSRWGSRSCTRTTRSAWSRTSCG